MFIISNIENFIKNISIAEIDAGGGNHINRGVCWIDSETVAVVGDFYPKGGENHTSEIHFHKILSKQESEIVKILKIYNLNLFEHVLYFYPSKNLFLAYSESSGLVIMSMEGEVLSHDPDLKLHSFYPDSGLFLWVSGLNVYVLKPVISE